MFKCSSSVYRVLSLLTIFLTLRLSRGQAMDYGNYQRMPPLGRGPLPKEQIQKATHVKPARTVADVAQEYWIENKCAYPPRTFFPMFREGCDVRLKAETFYAGICHAFFNSSKSLCKLEGATDDEKQTMLSIHELQETIEDDALCDTLAEMRNNDPTLFPRESDFTGKEKWFSLISALIFSPDTCSSACALDNAHPICFGYMLNYNYIEAVKTRRLESEKEEPEETTDEPKKEEGNSKEEVNEATEKNEVIPEKNNAEDEDNDDSDIPVTVDSFDPDYNLTFPFRPNPKLLNLKTTDPDYFFEDFDEDENFETERAGENDVILSEALEKDPDLFSKILEIGSPIIDDKDVEGDYPIDPDFVVDDLPQLTDDIFNKMEEAKSKEDFKMLKRPRLRGHVSGRMDRNPEVPMLSVLLALSGLLVVASLYFVFGLRKKIGSYVRHMRQRRRNNSWNYERVLIVQPDEDEYYE